MLKGTMQADHLAANKFQLIVEGLPALTPITVSGIAEELNAVDLPDRTRASAGNTNPTEIVIALPGHHETEIAAMEGWFDECKGDVAETYKKSATLVIKSISGAKQRAYSLMGCFVTRRSTPDLDMTNDGEQVNIEYAMSVDELLPI